jgi:ATP-dependent DNA ligase
LQLEGIIAKRKDSYYEPGKRNGAWVKYKINQSQEFVIGGYTPGHPFDALIVGCYEGTALKFVAKVRAGFVPHVRREIFKKLAGFATEKCPFTNLPEKRRTMWALTANEMKECHWLAAGARRSDRSSPSGRPMVTCGIRVLSGCGTIKSPSR